MTTYLVTAWCSIPHYTTFEVEAKSFKAALRKARKQAQDECPEPCIGASHDWNEFEIATESTDKILLHLEPEHALELAAPELLEAAILAEDVLSEFARLDDGTPSVSALHLLREAIRKTTRS